MHWAHSKAVLTASLETWNLAGMFTVTATLQLYRIWTRPGPGVRNQCITWPTMTLARNSSSWVPKIYKKMLYIHRQVRTTMREGGWYHRQYRKGSVECTKITKYFVSCSVVMVSRPLPHHCQSMICKRTYMCAYTASIIVLLHIW